jgi:hypothetical protein
VRTVRRPVWVSLRLLYGPQPERPTFRHGQALDLAQEVSGLLTGWYRGSDGRWYGLVSFAVPYLGLVPSVGLELTDQLVPADALRPRTYGRYRIE